MDLSSFTFTCTCCGQKPVRRELGETVVNLTSVSLPAAGLLLLSFCPGVLTLQSRVLLFLVKSPSVTGGRCFQRSLWWFHGKSVCMKSRLCPVGAVCPDPYYQDYRRFWVWCVMIGLLKWRCARRNIRSMNPPRNPRLLISFMQECLKVDMWRSNFQIRSNQTLTKAVKWFENSRAAD